LRSVLPGFAMMKPNTAAAFILCGIWTNSCSGICSPTSRGIQDEWRRLPHLISFF
jgi:hypothetical protein